MAYNGMAWIYANTSNNEQADSKVTKALNLDPENPNILETKGFILYNLGRHDDAIKLFDKVIGLDIRSKYAWYHKGKALYKCKKYDEALRCYNKSLDIDPNFAECYNDKAVALSEKNDFTNATETVKKAIQNKPSLAEAQENLSKIASASDRRIQNFWEFWSASRWRKVVAIIIGIYSLGIIILYPLYFGSETTETHEIDGNKSKTTVVTTPAKLPEIYLIVAGLTLLILLSPQIRTAKVGPVQLDMSKESPNVPTTLSLTKS